MSIFLKIAWRNITRNHRRSLITVSAVGFGLGALIFIWSFVDGAHKQMIENYTSLVTSHIQIHQKGFQQNQRLELNIAEADKILAQLKTIPGIKAMAPRIKAVGLVGSAESSAGVIVMGVEPEKEKMVSSLPRRIKSGTFLNNDDPEGIVIGASLAKNLNVDVGDKIVIMSQALDGSIASGSYRITGLMDTGAEEIDKGLALIHYATAQELFVMPGAASEIAIQARSAFEAPRIAKSIQKELNNPQLEILPWQEIAYSFMQWIEFDNGFIWIIVIVVMIVVAIGIMNTVLMGVLERTREFGILIALGTQRKEILWMVGFESFFLGLIGSAVGLTAGGLLTLYFQKQGINLSVFSNALNSFYIDALVFPILNFKHLATSIVLVLGTSMIVAIYPAWHAANLKPIEAIRSI